MNDTKDSVRIAFISEDMRDVWFAAFPKPDDTRVYTVRGLARGQWFYANGTSARIVLESFGGAAKLVRESEGSNQ